MDESTGRGRASACNAEIPEPQKEVKSIFRKLAKKHSSNIETGAFEPQALDVGIEFESAAIRYYEDHLKKAEDSLERKFI